MWRKQYDPKTIAIVLPIKLEIPMHAKRSPLMLLGIIFLKYDTNAISEKF